MLSQMQRSVFYSFQYPPPPPTPFFHPTTPIPHWSPNSCFQRTRHLLQGRQCSWVWTRKEWGRNREKKERISSVRLISVRCMEREKKADRESFLQQVLNYCLPLLHCILVAHVDVKATLEITHSASTTTVCNIWGARLEDQCEPDACVLSMKLESGSILLN